jgi:hypothetical protein
VTQLNSPSSLSDLGGASCVSMTEPFVADRKMI